MHKRIFDSAEKLEWLQIHKPHNTSVRRTAQDDGFVIEGPSAMKRRIDEFVAKYIADPA